jgi:hypothetical protein
VDPVTSPGSRRTGMYSRRFAVAQLLVMVAFAAVLLSFAYLISRSDSGQAWSSFKPKGHETIGKAQNLANYVAPRYVFNGAPIAVVQAQPLQFGKAEVDGIAFMRAPAQGVGSPAAQFEPAENTMLYVFCGPAAACGLPAEGAADMIVLLREEALELALYTLKYWPDVDSVVTLLPPSKTEKPALLLRRRKLKDQLSKPLEATLPKHDFVSPSSVTEAELERVARLTQSSIFFSSFEQTSNGHTLLLLGRR